MQLRGPLVGPDRWWYHTLLKGTVRDTLASYGSVPESGPLFPFDQGVLEPTCLPLVSISLKMKQTSFSCSLPKNCRSRCEMIPNLFHNHHPSPITFHIPLQFHCLSLTLKLMHSTRRLLHSLPLNDEARSGRRDLNPQPQPWQGYALPLSYFRQLR